MAGVLAPGQWVPSTSERADANGFEKLGIDNLLLPSGELVPFARRYDLAREEGTFDENSQAAQAELAWHIADDAIDRVNAHFNNLAEGSPLGGLLVVDELGRLEIWRKGGLTSAVQLLLGGPTPAFPHALVVVRDYLLEEVEALLSPAWPEIARIAPTTPAHHLVMEVCAASVES